MANSGGTDNYLVKYDLDGGLQWATRVDGTSSEITPVVSVDGLGNVLFGGIFSSTTTTIRNSNGTTFGTVTRVGGQDGLIVKYNSSGTAQWRARLTGTNNEYVEGIAGDTSGNVYILGSSFTNNSVGVAIRSSDDTIFTTLFGPAVTNLRTFVVKYDSSGIIQWVASLESTGGAKGYSICTDSSGSVYISGYNDAAVTIRNANGTTTHSLSGGSGSGGTEGFVIKFNTSGICQFAIRIGGTGSETAYSVAVDSSTNVYVTGYYGVATSLTIYNTSGGVWGTLTPSSGSDQNIFVLKYNSTGSPLWAGRIDGARTDWFSRVAVDTSGNVYVTGYYDSSPITIYNPSGGTVFTTLAYSGGSTTGLYDTFLVKYATNGTPQWATRIAGASDVEYDPDITVDGSGNVYLTASYGSTSFTIFNSGGTTFATVSKPTGGTAFVVKYNTSGTGQWYARMAGPTNLAYQLSNRIAYDPTGNIYVCGNYALALTLNSQGI